jgi:hypothetical protein
MNAHESGRLMSRKDTFIQSAFPGMLKGAPLGIVPKGNREEPAPPNLTTELRQGNRPMFMTGPEIKENYDPNYWDKKGMESSDDLWARKLQEAKRGDSRDTNTIPGSDDLEDGYAYTLEQSVRKEGVRKPVFLNEFSKTRDDESKPEVRDGHHRVAIASQIDPNMLIPVEHSP